MISSVKSCYAPISDDASTDCSNKNNHVWHAPCEIEVRCAVEKMTS